MVREPVADFVVLAAGAGTRFSDAAGAGTKLAARVKHRSVLGWTTHLAMVVAEAEGCELHLVIDPDRENELPDDLPAGCNVVGSPHSAQGMRFSIAAGLAACGDGRGAMIMLGDDPIAALALPLVLAHAHQQPMLVHAVLRDPPVPHPVYLPYPAFPEAPDPATSDDTGLAQMLAADTTQWLTPETPQPVDVDTPDDLVSLTAVLDELMSGDR